MRGPGGDGFAGQPPLSGSSPWIAAEPGLQPPSEEGVGGGSSAETGGSSGYGAGSGEGVVEGGSGAVGEGSREGAEEEREPYVSQQGKYLRGGRTVPLRSVEAGPFVMEVWVEEGRGKAEAVQEAERMRKMMMGGAEEREDGD